MLSLIHTLFDITFLRKGPEDLPYSWAVFLMCVLFWLSGLACFAILLQGVTAQHAVVDVLSWVLSLICFLVVLAVAGKTDRGLQTLSAIAGIGGVILYGELAVLILILLLIGPEFAGHGVMLVLLWSIPVKGHIMARAMDRPFFVGLVIALAVTLLRFAFNDALTPEP